LLNKLLLLLGGIDLPWKGLPSGEGNRRARMTYGLIQLNKA
jgi:hypothetical protein